jgi:hypothetical protein
VFYLFPHDFDLISHRRITVIRRQGNGRRRFLTLLNMIFSYAGHTLAAAEKSLLNAYNQTRPENLFAPLHDGFVKPQTATKSHA